MKVFATRDVRSLEGPYIIQEEFMVGPEFFLSINVAKKPFSLWFHVACSMDN